MINENNRFKQLAGISTSEGKKSILSEDFRDNIKDSIKESFSPANQLTKFEVQPDGNLKISITPEGLEYIKENKEIGWYELIHDLFEYNLSNRYSLVRPEDIGALTDSLIISDGIVDDETTREEFDQTNIWWFPEYETINEIDEFENPEKGYVIYSKATSGVDSVNENKNSKGGFKVGDLVFVKGLGSKGLVCLVVGKKEENDGIETQDVYVRGYNGEIHSVDINDMEDVLESSLEDAEKNGDISSYKSIAEKLKIKFNPKYEEVLSSEEELDEDLDLGFVQYKKDNNLEVSKEEDEAIGNTLNEGGGAGINFEIKDVNFQAKLKIKNGSVEVLEPQLTLPDTFNALGYDDGQRNVSTTGMFDINYDNLKKMNVQNQIIRGFRVDDKDIFKQIAQSEGIEVDDETLSKIKTVGDVFEFMPELESFHVTINYDLDYTTMLFKGYVRGDIKKGMTIATAKDWNGEYSDTIVEEADEKIDNFDLLDYMPVLVATEELEYFYQDVFVNPENDDEIEDLDEEIILEFDQEEPSDLEYFIDTYYNGQFKQLKTLLSDLKIKNKIKDLRQYVDEFGSTEKENIKNWIIDNL